MLPGYVASNFSKKMSDMLKEPEPAAPPVDAPPAPPIPPVDDGGDGHEGHDHAQDPIKSDGQ